MIAVTQPKDHYMLLSSLILYSLSFSSSKQKFLKLSVLQAVRHLSHSSINYTLLSAQNVGQLN